MTQQVGYRAVFSGDRWMPRRKEEVVGKVRRGELSFEQALADYELSADELTSWMGRYDRHGRRGLKITTSQVVR